ncbi:hypothetical protein ASPCADRAFT_211767 [Aspergillus carbonarius ITEM 5010]|uniref:Uncharacterized protein n=1 Tax=Aspergillus carbonarius (strain ITEM 5010) TaxID=602072 RepID=A0A1R3R8L3_ASPC5|nr:hypothetical protein ASPCADRAFT_211767 [Aspergillus carbonarius ITEM 5010]
MVFSLLQLLVGSFAEAQRALLKANPWIFSNIAMTEHRPQVSKERQYVQNLLAVSMQWNVEIILNLGTQ